MGFLKSGNDTAAAGEVIRHLFTLNHLLNQEKGKIVSKSFYFSVNYCLVFVKINLVQNCFKAVKDNRT